MHITPAQKRAIDQYYKELAAYQSHNVSHETAVRSAFQNLLATFAQSTSWLLVPEQPLANGKRPDGTLRDSFNLPRGYWEAKDSGDDLDTEIRKKIAIGYPVSNTIFEDTRRAVLYQGNKRVLDADLSRQSDLIAVIDRFFHYSEPDIENFERAVEEFKESIPDLAQGLLKIIKEEHARNRAFVAAFSAFLEQCRASLDPNMSSATVDEMLVQHLLTERLFRTVFDNSDFISRNVIAAEIEKVIQALTSRAFNRREFLKSLDRFYLAIENAARGLDDWTEKQHFLNTVYERFFQGFSVKQADTHGIVYTPQEIVDFMVASVDDILRREFHASLSQPGVQILDPCVGTGNFLVNLIQRISGGTLRHKYSHDLFCNEIMLLPYYIASLNIEHAYYERTGEYLPFEGICFADTLELAEGRQMPLFVEKNTERVEYEKAAQIMVVIGNPPYNVGQKSENDNNKNRRYPVIDERIYETYVKGSRATNNRAVSDAYVKFFRWAADRLGGRDGIVCFVSNNGFLDGIAFDMFRRRLAEDFTSIYHLDLGGNARKRGGGNVFGIMVGVGITILIRKRNKAESPGRPATILYHKVIDRQNRIEKLSILTRARNIYGLDWQTLHPDNKDVWLTEGMQAEFADFLPMGAKDVKSSHSLLESAIFRGFGGGVKTNRDSWVYDFDRNKLVRKVSTFISFYTAEVDRWRRRSDNSIDIDSFVTYDDTKIKWSDSLKSYLRRQSYATFSENSVVPSLFRPFCRQWLYFDRFLNERVYQLPLFFPPSEIEGQNIAICVPGIGDRLGFGCLATEVIPNLDIAFEKAQCFPYYTYSEDGSNRRENITDWALAQFQTRYGEQVSKWDIFHYVYAMLHHPQYRERYAENLKRELPRIPLLRSRAAFETCARIGRQLMELHLNYEQAAEYPLAWVENRDVPVNWRVEKMRLTPNKDALVVNDWLTLSGIPQACFQYRLGNRSALEWVIDQYQVSTDARSGITSDPNREDEPEYIVRLVGKVVQVSVETVRLVGELAQTIRQEDWLNETAESEDIR
jgi:predicted helicase